MKYVIKDDTSIEYAEERRLFYVAMTRTKNRVFIATPENHPSEFILELIKDYPNIILYVGEATPFLSAKKPFTSASFFAFSVE